MKYLLILAFCLCGALATPIENETSPDELATDLDFVEDVMDEVEDFDVEDLEDEGNVTRLSTIVEILKILINKNSINCILLHRFSLFYLILIISTIFSTFLL